MNAMFIAQYIQDRPFMMEHSENSWLHGLFGLLMLAIVVAGVIWVANILVQRQDVKPSTQEPIDIAKERYARGEISKAEFAEIRKELQDK